jgi:hypothetical protein
LSSLASLAEDGGCASWSAITLPSSVSSGLAASPDLRAAAAMTDRFAAWAADL